jgi:nitric oxide reductase NorQ protein
MTTTPATRLGPGELRRQVAAYLSEHCDRDHTPAEVARALGGRSTGAIGNALRTLVDQGGAAHSGTRPNRYRATDSTASAATPSGSPATARSTSPGRMPGSTGSSPAPGRTGPVRGPVRRPSGQVYHPRFLADLPDVAALRRLRDAGIPALLYGPPGTGKTSLVEAAFPDLITVAGDGDTTVADFIGEYTQADDGKYEFVYGPLVTAMVAGRCLFIDDATLIGPKVLAVVYPALDGRRQIAVKAHKGEIITAAPGFYVIAGHNPGVHGAVLTEALASRFAAQIQVSTDYDLARALKIDPKAVQVARNLATRQASGEIGWAPQLRELIAYQRIADVLGADAAVANLVGIAPEEDRDVVAAAVAAVFGRRINPLALGRQI